MARGKFFPDGDIANSKLVDAAKYLVAGSYSSDIFTMGASKKIRTALTISDFDNSKDLVSREYVQSLLNNLDPKGSVLEASSANLPALTTATDAQIDTAFSGTGSTDNFEDVDHAAPLRVLLKDQTTQNENGIYDLVKNATDDWDLTRSSDFDASSEVTGGATVFVEYGTHINQRWSLKAKVGGGAYTVDTDALIFLKMDYTAVSSGDSYINVSGGVVTLNTGSIDNAAVDASAAIAGSKLSSGTMTEQNVITTNDDVTAALNKLDLKWGDLASVTNGEGAALVGVEDSAGNFTGTDVEAVLAELQTAIDAVDGSVPTNDDKDLTCSVTTSLNDLVCATAITNTAVGYVRVSLRGFGDLVVGDSVTSGHVYWADTGTTTVAIANEGVPSGKKLYRGSQQLGGGFEFDANDEIDLSYNV